VKVNRLGRCIAFGDFELYPEAGKLYKLGCRVTTARPQEVSLLTMLIERAGVMVSRNDIEVRLWPNTRPPKNRLNVVVSEARSALGDTNKEPRKYIATLGEDGYCFIHPIKRVEHATGSYEDIEAERAYRAGMQCLENREDASLRNAVVCFKCAISQNPSHARAWVGLADAYLIMGIHCVDAPSDTYPKAQAAAEEAARIDKSLPEALVSPAMVDLCYFRRVASAEEKFNKALKARPSLSLAHNGMGLLYAATGRADEFVTSLNRAIGFSPLSPPLHAFLCYSLCFTRRFEDAIIAGRKAVLGDSESYLAHLLLGNALLYRAQYNEALIHLETACSLSHDSKNCVGFWAYACARAGLRKKAERALSKLTSLPRHEYVPSYFVGLIHLGLGSSDVAIDWFNRACEERSHWVIFLNSDPTFDELRKHPRFKDLLEKIGLQNLGDAPKGRERNRRANDFAR
jgi:DNA-binding winged helix-turn-helix (wHTH) protein/Flp pilus assembly protein TadD